MQRSSDIRSQSPGRSRPDGQDAMPETARSDPASDTTRMMAKAEAAKLLRRVGFSSPGHQQSCATFQTRLTSAS